ncbi:MAG: hypothetical protein ACSHX0_12865 [Akkermansiaceae bacterium]
MSEHYYLRYTPVEGAPQNEVDLRTLGQSLIGFSRISSEFTKILRIRGEIRFSATTFKDGSVIVDTLVELQKGGDALFSSAQDYFDLLQLSSRDAWAKATSALSVLKDGYEDLEDYFAKHPIQLGLVLIAVTKLVEKAGRQKNKPQLDDEELPARIAQELHALLKTKTFKNFLEPITQDQVQSIEVSSDKDFKESSKIDEKNFQDYLPEDEQILPHLLPNSTHELEGDITSMKSTRGDSLTFHYESGGKGYNLDLLPEHGKSTKIYTSFYKERVITVATVIRKSMYQKPKLRIEEINHLSPYLEIDDDSENEQQIQQST